MLIQNQEMETRLQRLENEKNQIIEDDNKQLDEGESSELFVKTITRMKMQKRYVKVKILIKPNFLKEFLALVDSGSNINCVPEGLIQTLFFEKNLSRCCKCKLTTLGNIFQIFKCTYL